MSENKPNLNELFNEDFIGKINEVAIKNQVGNIDEKTSENLKNIFFEYNDEISKSLENNTLNIDKEKIQETLQLKAHSVLGKGQIGGDYSKEVSNEIISAVDKKLADERKTGLNTGNKISLEKTLVFTNEKLNQLEEKGKNIRENRVSTLSNVKENREEFKKKVMKDAPRRKKLKTSIKRDTEALKKAQKMLKDFSNKSVAEVTAIENKVNSLKDKIATNKEARKARTNSYTVAKQDYKESKKNFIKEKIALAAIKSLKKGLEITSNIIKAVGKKRGMEFSKEGYIAGSIDKKDNGMKKAANTVMSSINEAVITAKDVMEVVKERKQQRTQSVTR